MKVDNEMPKNFNAVDLQKQSITVEEVNNIIWAANNIKQYKTFIMAGKFISDEVKLDLLARGFKCSYGDWDGVMTNVFLIEW